MPQVNRGFSCWGLICPASTTQFAQARGPFRNLPTHSATLVFSLPTRDEFPEVLHVRRFPFALHFPASVSSRRLCRGRIQVRSRRAAKAHAKADRGNPSRHNNNRQLPLARSRHASRDAEVGTREN